MKGRIALGAMLLISMVAAAAWANGPAAVRKQVEASLLVTGMITIQTDGGVAAVELDKPEKLPEGIADFVRGNIAEWRFEPQLADGKPARVRTKMSVRLVAKSVGNGQMRASILGADFGDYEAMPPAERITEREMTPPVFPILNAQSRVQGTAYLLVKIEPDGTVSDVAVEQVNLRVIDSEARMGQYRRRFARAAVAAAEHWTFNPPTQGEAAKQTQWVVRVPVVYAFHGEERGYGQWEAYVPGPRERVAWAAQDDPAFSPDALPEGGIYLAGGNKGPKLLTPLGEDS